MPDFKVEVDGRKPRKRRTPGKRPSGWLSVLLRSVVAGLRFILVQPALLVVVLLALFVWFVGTPHVGGSYTCNGPLREGGGCDSYDSCTFYGIHGRRVVYPEEGEQCHLFRFMRINWQPGDPSSLVRVPTDQATAKIPLNKERALPLYWGVIAGQCGNENYPSSKPLCNRVFDVMTDYSVLECTYGPIDSDGTGWRIYNFWHNAVPDEIESFTAPGEEPPFLILGKLAVTSCPQTSDEAYRLFQAGRL